MVVDIRTDPADRTTRTMTTIEENEILKAMQQVIWTTQVANDAKKQLLRLLRRHKIRRPRSLK